MSDLLNPAQLRSVEITLRTFEKDLRLTAAWLDGEEENRLYRRKLTIPTEQRKAVRQRINSALEQIAILARTLNLPLEEEDVIRLIQGRLAVSWANLINSQSSKLKRYGDVDPVADRTLDPAIRRLVKLVQELESIIEG